MNNKIAPVLFTVLVITCLFSIYQIFQLKSELREIKKGKTEIPKDTTKVEAVEEEFELAPIMGRMQVYANKLWFAGDAENWELSAFYIEEIEEAMEEIEESNAEENGVNLSQAVKEWGLTPIKNLEKTVESKDKKQFILEYDNLTINCSGCHTTTKHSYIRIIRPTSPIFTNQKYSIQ